MKVSDLYGGSMKVAAIAALGILVVLPAEAGKRHGASNSPIATCDNDGRCTTFKAGAPIYGDRTSRTKVHNATAVSTTIKSATPPTISNAEAKTDEATKTTPAVTLAVRKDPEVTTETTVIAAAPTSDREITTGVVTSTPSVASTAMVKGALDSNGNKAPGIVVSSKTGARAQVGTAFAARFQAYINDLEKNYGARVLFMGGIRPGRCLPESQHPCGKALDVCQLGWGKVDPRCNLPDRVTLGRIAAAHGLFEGGRWCHSDYGHVQTGVTAAACGDGPFRIVRRAPETATSEARP
jgi:Tfp pilus assembly major pilin PilA